MLEYSPGTDRSVLFCKLVEGNVAFAQLSQPKNVASIGKWSGFLAHGQSLHLYSSSNLLNTLSQSHGAPGTGVGGSTEKVNIGSADTKRSDQIVV